MFESDRINSGRGPTSPLPQEEEVVVIENVRTGKVVLQVRLNSTIILAEDFDPATSLRTTRLHMEIDGRILEQPNILGCYAVSHQLHIVRIEDCRTCSMCTFERNIRRYLHRHHDAFPGTVISQETGEPSYLCLECARENARRIAAAKSFWSMFSLKKYVIF